MKLKNLKRWKLRPELDGMLFFAQRVDELLWDFTLDTYKPSALNAPFLCIEALALCDDVASGLIEKTNLSHVLEELVWSVSQDPIAKSLLDLPIEQYVLVGENVKPADQKLRLEVLGRTLEPHRYLSECFDQICVQVNDVAKKKIDHSARSMITTLVNMGVSKRFLFGKTQDFFFSAHATPLESPEQVRDFLRELSPLGHHFRVYFVASDLIRNLDNAARAFDIEVLDTLPTDVAQAASQANFSTDTGECFVKVFGISGFDVYSAYEEAAQTLDKLSDLFTLFHHQGKVEWKGRAIVEQCCLDAPVVLEANAGPMQKAFDMSAGRASKELNRLIENFAARGLSRDRFHRVADLHGICVTSDVVENQLVNLWTGLETLVPTHAGGASNIVKMMEAMLPFLMAAYVRRLVMRLSHDLVVWRPWKVRTILKNLPEGHGPTMLEKTLCLLCDAEAKQVRELLYKELTNYPLLRHRIFQLSEVLSSPRSIEKLLEQHEKKVRWQIRRIYRTRNLIVHSGRKPSYIHSLIENGHDYLDQILFDVMKLCCGEYRATSLEQSFELGKLRYQRFRRNLSECVDFSSRNYTFLCEERDSLESIVRAPWGYERWGSEASAEADESAAVVAADALDAAARK